MGKMESQTPMLLAFGSDELAALRADIAALRAEIAQVRMTPMDEWIKVQEYAKIVGRSERTVREWIKSGQVESKRTGGVLLVRR
ncbi:DNA-binding protein [Sinirhodobacter populi]|uniref:DNA-binding protein n=1 Tax=Paenirhodobacter populi TaxID=2306993 RepID=A0A443K7M4_9RHOB|nr:helix-turn-helix domain-containing protein [Sinirhodobacter populi]RWR28799.1 DNA-binding protein [Sinirhodobacter populi]